MNRIKILVNAVTSKKKAGGVFQISLNFIRETIKHNDIDWYIIVSNDLDKEIGSLNKLIPNTNYFVFENQPNFIKSYLDVRRKIKDIELIIKPDIVYSIAAPSYFSFTTKEVMRFTNPWVTHPNKFAYKSLSVNDKIYIFLYGLLQKYLMRSCDFFITQSNTAKKGIKKITGVPEQNISVVPNVLPASYKNYDKIKNILLKKQINIACVSVPHPHKDIEIVPYVIKALKDNYDIDNICFNITIPEKHPSYNGFMQKVKELSIENSIKNWGYCTQKQLVALYSNCQIFFLPTLLETFSASLLEAMYFNLPIVASDFDFNKDVAKDAALYYKPNNYDSAAEKIALLINDSNLYDRKVIALNINLKEYSNYTKHFEDTVSFLKSCAVAK